MKLAQSLGINQCHYAIIPHAGDWQAGNLYEAAERFELPLETAQAGKGGGDLPQELSFLEVSPRQVVLSALKRCEYRDTLVLRMFNPTSQTLLGQVACRLPLTEAWLTNMNEERRERLPVAGGTVSVPFGHKKIVTVELVLDRSVQ
jgi:alpha-mannosidase